MVAVWSIRSFLRFHLHLQNSLLLLQFDMKEDERKEKNRRKGGRERIGGRGEGGGRGKRRGMRAEREGRNRERADEAVEMQDGRRNAQREDREEE